MYNKYCITCTCVIPKKSDILHLFTNLFFETITCQFISEMKQIFLTEGDKNKRTITIQVCIWDQKKIRKK